MNVYHWQRIFIYLIASAFFVAITLALWRISDNFIGPQEVEHYNEMSTHGQETHDESRSPNSERAYYTRGDMVQETPNYNLHVFYYAWYGNTENDGEYHHWNHRILPSWREKNHSHPMVRYQPPADIGASFYPKLGAYSSRDVEIVKNHMKQMKDAGIGVVAVSWYPPNLHDDEGINDPSLMTLLFDQADLLQLKVCFHIEPFKNRSIETLRHALVHIVAKYGDHAAFYKHVDLNSGRTLPLYYIYDSYLVEFEAWERMLHPVSTELNNEKLSVRETELDGFFIALLVERNHMERISQSGFDGFYTYFGTDTFTYGSNPRNWFSLAQFAREKEMVFIPSVAPGYNDERIRPWNKINSRARRGGSYYENAFRSAVATNPPLISITSFNEWHEGTQIEEAIPKEHSSYIYLNYLPKQHDHYLKLTSKWSFKYSEKKILAYL